VFEKSPKLLPCSSRIAKEYCYGEVCNSRAKCCPLFPFFRALPPVRSGLFTRGDKSQSFPVPFELARSAVSTGLGFACAFPEGWNRTGLLKSCNTVACGVLFPVASCTWRRQLQDGPRDDNSFLGEPGI